MKYKKTCRNSSALIKNSEKQLTSPKFIYYFQFMNLGSKYQGKIATTDDVEFINKLIAENPNDGRRTLSKKVCVVNLRPLSFTVLKKRGKSNIELFFHYFFDRPGNGTRRDSPVACQFC